MGQDGLKQSLQELLEPHGQQHVLRFWGELAQGERERLAAQLRALDFALIERLQQETDSGEDWAALAQRAVAPPAFRLNDAQGKISANDARRAGEEKLREGRLGALIVAGGQGTRLGFDAPKGMFPIGPVSGATLFQILVEKVIALGRRYDVSVPLYVMTSPATHDATVEFFAEHQQFGLPDGELNVFCQGTMPAVDAETHQLLLAEKGSLALSPDGHGGTLAALVRSGALDDVERRGLKQLFYLQVDNALVQLGDPTFLGYHLLSQSELSTQVKAKTHPDERVGNVVSIDGQLRIIEYSDLPSEAGERRDASGGLELWAGNLAVHIFDVAFLRRSADIPDRLPFHRALKKVPFVNEKGQRVEPDAPNAIKFERFIFDLLPHADHAIVVEVDPERAFAPLKNAPGAADSTPESVRAQMIALHTEWLQAAGATVAPGVPVEISPLFAESADELRNRLPDGFNVVEPTYLHEIASKPD